MWKRIRVVILLFILALVAANTWLTQWRTTDWDRTLWVGIYPISGDGSQRSANYIKGLTAETFAPVARYLAQEAARYKIAQKNPVEIKLAAEINAKPPEPPENRNIVTVGLWSLQLRWWAWKHQRLPNGANPDIQIFVLYHDPDQHDRLRHSLGLQKGLIGVVNAFATRSQAGSNNVIITHELLHTVGASDKYDPATNMPIYPQGYAEPDANPRHPQRYAEIMGGRIPVNEQSAEIPAALKYTQVGLLTAQEIGWVEK